MATDTPPIALPDSPTADVAAGLNAEFGSTPAAPTLPIPLPEPKLSPQAVEVLTLVVLFAGLFGGNTWKSIAALAKAALNGTLTETALLDLEALLSKHGIHI